MRKKNKKEVTIDVLASMVQHGFDEVKKDQSKLERDLRKEMQDMGGRIEQRMDKLENRMDTQFTDIDNKLQSYTSFWHRKYSEHEVWLQNLDRSVASIERQLKK
jgi:G:T-mismatch repair DNA endonuclease (very short patch repair protein)